MPQPATLQAHRIRYDDELRAECRRGSLRPFGATHLSSSKEVLAVSASASFAQPATPILLLHRLPRGGPDGRHMSAGGRLRGSKRFTRTAASAASDAPLPAPPTVSILRRRCGNRPNCAQQPGVWTTAQRYGHDSAAAAATYSSARNTVLAASARAKAQQPVSPIAFRPSLRSHRAQ